MGGQARPEVVPDRLGRAPAVSRHDERDKRLFTCHHFYHRHKALPDAFVNVQVVCNLTELDAEPVDFHLVVQPTLEDKVPVIAQVRAVARAVEPLMHTADFALDEPLLAGLGHT